MMTFEIWAADCTVLAVQALLSQVQIVRLSYILDFECSHEKPTTMSLACMNLIKMKEINKRENCSLFFMILPKTP